MNNIKCRHHPDRNATHITNLGSPIDKDTPACQGCAANVQQVIDQSRYDISPTVKTIAQIVAKGSYLIGDVHGGECQCQPDIAIEKAVINIIK
jgi:hypothetical protein